MLVFNRKIIMFLKSEACAREMISWVSSECPPPDKDMKKVIKDAASRFAEKLAATVDVWEKQNDIVSRVKFNILKTFQRDLDLFEDQIKKIEGMLICCIPYAETQPSSCL